MYDDPPGQTAWRVTVHAKRSPQRTLEWVAQNEGGPGPKGLWHGVLLDVSERERLQNELREQVATDELTRLPNRRGLMAQRQALSELDALRSRARRVSELGLVGFWERNLVTGAGDADPTTRRLLDVAAGQPMPSWADLAERATDATRPALQAYFDQLAQGEERGVIEFSLHHRQGQVVQLHAVWTREGDQVLGVLAEVGALEGGCR